MVPSPHEAICSRPDKGRSLFPPSLETCMSSSQLLVSLTRPRRVTPRGRFFAPSVHGSGSRRTVGLAVVLSLLFCGMASAEPLDVHPIRGGFEIAAARIRAAEAVQVEPSIDGAIVATVYFETARSEVEPAYAPRLAAATSMGPLLVAGYANPIGSAQFNERLALRRAEALAGSLRAAGAVVVAVVSGGMLSCPDHEPDCLAKARRAEARLQ